MAITRKHIPLLRDALRKELSTDMSGESEYRNISIQLRLEVGNDFVPNVTPVSHLGEKLTKTSES